MVPGNAGSKNLMPLYNNLTAGIRSVDKQHLVFYEVGVWDAGFVVFPLLNCCCLRV
jgi:hypothetical protein